MENNSEIINGVYRPDTVINSDVLKIFAMAIMLTDHIGAFLVSESAPAYWPLRTIGRLAFPIFCYLIAEGAYYTRSKLKYMARMAAFALISTPPYNLVHGSEWWSWNNINVFFTLFFGVAAIYSITDLPKSVFRLLGSKSLSGNAIACGLLGLPLCFLCYMAAYWMHTDYGEYGVAAILVFGLLRKKPVAAWLGFAVLTFVFFEFFIRQPVSDGGFVYSRVNLYNVITKLLSEPDAELYFYNQKQMYAPLAFIPCMLYNGKRGKTGRKAAKYLFYAFYPVHLLCLWLVQLAMK